MISYYLCQKENDKWYDCNISFNNKRKWKKQKINAKVYKGESEQKTFQ